MNTIDTQAWIVRDAEAEQVQDGEFSRIILLADGEHTGGGLTVNRARLEVGSPGAPSHRHLHATETIFVIDGSLDVLVGEEVSALGARRPGRPAAWHRPRLRAHQRCVRRHARGLHAGPASLRVLPDAGAALPR